MFKTPYTNPADRLSLSFEGTPEITQQNFKNETDVNTILRRYDKTGLITHVNNAAAQYGDFTAVNEYKENLNAVIAAQDAFDQLPSDIRKRFGNDPGEFFEFATNPTNQEDLVKLGLANAPQYVPVLDQDAPITTPEKA